MQCDQCREALSARLDDEALPAGTTATGLEEHLTSCEACRTWHAGAQRQHRDLRVRAAEPVPDLTARIVAAVPRAAVPSRAAMPRDWVRYALLAVALTQLVLALPALLLGEDAGASIHVARELGSFDIAIAVGFLWVAWQPARAAGLLPMAVALGAAIVGTAVLDVLDSRAGAASEAHHVLDLAGVALVWLLTRASSLALPRLRGTVTA